MTNIAQLPKISLFLGGARSGKSAFAEQSVLSTGLKPVYLATAENRDTEMNGRIKLHKSRRGNKWRSLEEPLQVSDILGSIAPTEIVLIDCLTLWLTNQMLSDADLTFETAKFLNALQNCAGKVVCVSNEVGMGIVPDNKMARQFRDAQGVLNQQVAKISDLSVFVIAGLPMVLKGKLPEVHHDR